MNRIIKVNGQPVWDYKIVQTSDDTLYLSLITETYGDEIKPEEFVVQRKLPIKMDGLAKMF